MPSYHEPEQLTVREALSLLNVADLKPLAVLVGSAPTRKGELVDLLARQLEDVNTVRSLYGRLDDMSQKAVQEATHDLEGILLGDRFVAKYGKAPNFGDGRKPTPLRLFFPQFRILPSDLQELLRTFVPEPPPLVVRSSDELPSEVVPACLALGGAHGQRAEDQVALRVRHTARAALHDLKAMLRLVDAGSVKVGGKTRRPSQATTKAVAAVLLDGDFYGPEDAVADAWDPVSDLTMQPFAWPMLVQAGGLAEATGSRLQLTAAGRKATTAPAHEVIRQVWQRWQTTTLVDEFNRVEAIKGQQAKGRGLTASVPRRQAVVEALEAAPAGKWLAIDEVFRLIQVEAPDLQVTHNSWKLYIADQQYGSLGHSGYDAWEIIEGRFVLAFLFEYAATLGLIDVAFISPRGARVDYHSCWGTDDFSCLSRYDGLLFVRINPLGAWCLGTAEAFVPEVVPAERVLTVLANRDVVAAERAPSAADVLFLDRFAERRSDKVWNLTAEKILEAVEQGLAVKELREFLTAQSDAALPQTVEVFLTDLESKAGQLEDLGAARLIACSDAMVARTLAHDRRLRKLVQLAGERHLVFRSSDEAALRRALRELGYVLPPPQ